LKGVHLGGQGSGNWIARGKIPRKGQKSGKDGEKGLKR